MPLAYLIGLSAALHLYIRMPVAPALPGPLFQAALTLLLVVSALFVPLGMFARRLSRPPVADTLAAIGLFFMGLFSSLLVFTVLRDIVLVLVGLVDWAAPGALPEARIQA